MKTEAEMLRVLQRIMDAVDRWRSLKDGAPTNDQMVKALAALERRS